MSTYTKNLNLFKYDVTADEKVPFSITDALNNNWDIIDEKCKGSGGLELCDIGMALYVDETKGLRRYLNGQVVDINTNTQAFLNRLKEITTLHPSLLCTEEEWQTAKTLSAFGQVGKFVFNYSGDEIVSVRLPRVVNIQGLFDLQKLGMTVSESLPNITGTIIGDSDKGVANISIPSGCFSSSTYSRTNQYSSSKSSGNTMAMLEFSAHNSNAIYQDNAPVQQEAIQYPYFIQIATGSETENNIINEIELNNPFSLFDSKYSDHELNNLSWLKSEGQWNAKAVYPTAYDKLLKVYNGTETVEGLSVKLSTETYTDYDFVLNTTDETFRLPLKTKLASGKAVVGNGKAMVGLRNLTSPAISQPEFYFGKNPKDDNVTIWNSVQAQSAIGITTDPTKSGIELADSNLYLYFYVGETVQNANLIDAGRIGEQLATKTDMLQASGAGMPSNKYIDLTLGASGTTYTAPANGYFVAKGNASTGAVQGQLWLIDEATSLSSQVYSTQAIVTSAFIPVKKGHVVILAYAAFTVKVLKFIYAEGEV